MGIVFPYLLMLISSVTSLAEGILIKQYNKRHNKGGFIFTAIVSLFSMLFFIFKDLIVDPHGLQFPVEILPYAIISGVLYCAASLTTYLALQTGSFAITMLILSYSLVISILYGLIFLGEPANVFTYIGFAAIAASIFLVRGKQANPETKGKKFSVKWLIYMIISVLGSGFLSVVMRMQQIDLAKLMEKPEYIEKYGAGATFDSEFMIICLAISAVTLFVVGIVKDGNDIKYIFKNGTPFAGAAGVANGATNMLGMWINTLIAISIATPTRSAMKTVVSFLVSLLVFKEKFETRQIIGVTLGAVAVVFLNINI